jgi:tryptophan 2,3-dioxygenase
MTDQRAALTYSSYLGLDEVLGPNARARASTTSSCSSSSTRSTSCGSRSSSHEGAHLQGRLEEGDTPHALHTLKRMLTILKTVVAQIDVLETMTPRQFMTFRDRLEAASGFQSAQFRELEALLGRRDPRAGGVRPRLGRARPDSRGDGAPVAVRLLRALPG